MATLEMMRQMRIEELRTEIRHRQNEMAPFVAARTTDEDDYLENWRTVAAMQTELRELKEEKYAERTSIVGPATWPTSGARHSREVSSSLVVAETRFLVGEGRLKQRLPVGRVPRTDLPVCPAILLRNGVSANDHLQFVFRPNEAAKEVNMGARRVADDHAGCQMDDLNTVVLHFRGRVFDVSGRATAAGGIADQLDVFTLIDAERAFAAPHDAKTFPASTRAIPVTDDNSESDEVGHVGCSACFRETYFQLSGTRTATTSPRTHTCPFADTVAVTTTLRRPLSFTFPRISRGTPMGVGRT